MKRKTSITLSEAAIRALDQLSTNRRGRSEVIEEAIWLLFEHVEQQRRDQRDLKILDDRADDLNEEAEDVLAYQVEL